MAIDLVKELKDKKQVFGSKEAIKQINKGNAETIYLAKDCLFADAILNSAKEKGIEIKKLDISSEQMKVLCKKPFSVSVISVLKEKSSKKVSSKEKIKKEIKTETKTKTRKSKKEAKKKK